MAPKNRVTKSAAPTSFAIGDVKISPEDMRTLAAITRFGGIQFNTDDIATRLGITRNAFALRWRRVRIKLERLPLDTPTTPTSAGARGNVSDDIDAMISEMTQDTTEDAEEAAEGDDEATA